MQLSTSQTIQDEVMSFLLSAPSAQQIIEFRASDAAQERLRMLLDANREGTLSAEERGELEEASQINHFVILLKARAHMLLES